MNEQASSHHPDEWNHTSTMDAIGALSLPIVSVGLLGLLGHSWSPLWSVTLLWIAFLFAHFGLHRGKGIGRSWSEVTLILIVMIPVFALLMLPHVQQARE